MAFRTIGTRGSRKSLNASLTWTMSERRFHGRDSQDETRIAMLSCRYPTTELERDDLGYADRTGAPIASAAGDSGHAGAGADTYEACARFAWKSAIWDATNCSFKSRRTTM